MRCTCFAVCLLAAAPAAAADRPNILVVLSDDHSAPHVGCYGNTDIKTPNLDRFAAEGMRFDRAYVACPAVRAVAGGDHDRPLAGRHSDDAVLRAAAGRDPGLPRAAAANGYFAGVAGRTYHLDGSRLPPESQTVFDRYGLRTFPKRLDFVKTGGRPQMLDQFREFLDRVPKGKPFVLQLCFNDPHRPLDRNAIPEPHDPAKLKLPAALPGHEARPRGLRPLLRRDSPVRRRLRRGAGGADEARPGTRTRSSLMMGDNGAAQLRGKGTLYEFGVRVPLLVRWPGVVKPGAATAI